MRGFMNKGVSGNIPGSRPHSLPVHSSKACLPTAPPASLPPSRRRVSASPLPCRPSRRRRRRTRSVAVSSSRASRPAIPPWPGAWNAISSRGKRPFSTGCPMAECSSRRDSVTPIRYTGSPARSACASSSVIRPTRSRSLVRPMAARRTVSFSSRTTGETRTRSSTTTPARAVSARSPPASSCTATPSGRTTASASPSTETTVTARAMTSTSTTSTQLRRRGWCSAGRTTPGIRWTGPRTIASCCCGSTSRSARVTCISRMSTPAHSPRWTRAATRWASSPRSSPLTAGESTSSAMRTASSASCATWTLSPTRSAI